MMGLTFLSKAYLPAGSFKPLWGGLYKEILKVQTKEDYTARCLLPETPGGSDGKLVSRTSIDPMEEMPFDIIISNPELVDELSFSSSERPKFVTPPQGGPGITGGLQLTEDRCGIADATGGFRMKHAFTVEGVDGEDVQIIEGYLSFTHSGLYKRKGHGSDTSPVLRSGLFAPGRTRTEYYEIGLTENQFAPSTERWNM
jgi:hypothetical protein